MATVWALAGARRRALSISGSAERLSNNRKDSTTAAEPAMEYLYQIHFEEIEA